MEELEIIKLDTDAVGVGKLNSRTVLVDGVLPEEVVKIDHISNKGKYDTANVVNVLKSNPCRVIPKCPYYATCGGCTLQHANTEFEKEFKIKKVSDAFKYIAGKDIEVDDYINCNDMYNYRNKSVFAVKDGVVGMYSARSHDVIDVVECAIASDGINQFYITIRPWLKNYAKDINHVVIREINGKYICVLVGVNCPDVTELINLLDDKYSNRYQLVFNKNDAKKDIITDNIKILHGNNIMAKICGITMPISANSFLQVNDKMSEKLYKDVLHIVQSKEVINAYSGAGLLTSLLAKSCNKVYGVEIVPNAHKNAEDLKKSNNIHNMINICGDAREVLPDIIKGKENITLIIDPPRKGVDNKLLEYINNSSNIKEIIYIACSPNSLAKNYARLTNYDISSVKLYNLFPRTHHVETVAVLRRMEG